jgi:PAS domain S-box-containing protein
VPPHALPGIDPAFIDNLLVPASVHALDGVIVHVNEPAERAAGVARRVLVGRHVLDPIPREARAVVASAFRRAVEEGEPTEVETVFDDDAGRRRGVRAQYLPLFSGDAVVGVLILAFDARPVEPERFAPHLTSRQREILRLVADGLSTAEIARELTISTETVRNHLRNAFGELGAHTRLEAIATARRLGLLSPPPLGASNP